jgi:dihydropteroate synthase
MIFLNKKINFLKKIGIKHNNIIIDPGIGFGKNLKHNINLISNISIFHSLGFPILVGNSKKRFIKEIAGKNDTKEQNWRNNSIFNLSNDARCTNFTNS